MNLSLLNSLCYMIGWGWCVFLGISHQSLLAAIVAVLLILIQLYWTRKNEEKLYVKDFILLCFSFPLGALLEFFLIQTNSVHYVSAFKMLPPLWIVFLYPQFSLLINHSLKILQKSYLAAFFVGFFGAPFSYIAGAHLGGLIFPSPFIQTWLVIGICWGLFLCVLIKIAHIIEIAATETFKERQSSLALQLLYDGECPLCKREICYLKKRDKERKTEFVDISSEGYRSSGDHKVDYNTAMSQMHAVDGQGNILIGLAAFAAVYARSGLLVISTWLRIPFIKTILNPIYGLFAKYRLWITGRNNVL